MKQIKKIEKSIQRRMRSHRNDPNNIFAPVRSDTAASTTRRAAATGTNGANVGNGANKSGGANVPSTSTKSMASVGTQATLAPSTSTPAPSLPSTSASNINTNTITRPKPAAPQATASTEVGTELRIIIIDENWSQYCYRIKMNTPFGKLITRFCAQIRRIDQKSILFWYHGRLVEDEDTPKTLNVKDGEVILAHYI